ncbi:MAG: AAA family ATPase [Alphaproteobacteria bacterium]
MLERLYVNNFRCLVNFELKLDRINLLLGINGSGKSCVFDVLRKIQSFIINEEKVSDIFPSNDKTNWLGHDIQRFELDISTGEHSKYSYKLDIRHDDLHKKVKVTKEELRVDEKPLFVFCDDKATLYRDDHTVLQEYPFNLWRSGVGYISERKDCTKLTHFTRELERLIVVRPIPALFEKVSPNEDSLLTEMMENFPSWYRHVSLDSEFGTKLTTELANVLLGFRSLNLIPLGENAKLLKASFDSPSGSKFSLNFSSLSDGQKMLIALYALFVFSSLQNQGVSLFIDEPDNFLALPEIQPWLSTLFDACGESVEQTVLISHHPEIIDYLGNAHGRWFEREGNEPVRVRDKPKQAVDGLSLSETVARGWEQ